MTPATRAGRLDVDAVVAAAAEIADADGLEAVTLAAVAARLGIRSPSLYNPRRRAARPAADAHRAIGELGAALRDAAVGRSGEEAIRAVATAFRDYARAHPGLYAATVRAIRSALHGFVSLELGGGFGIPPRPRPHLRPPGASQLAALDARRQSGRE